jgi:hypothetical protein
MKVADPNNTIYKMLINQFKTVDTIAMLRGYAIIHFKSKAFIGDTLRQQSF